MTYQVLANKWRPKDFTEVISQQAAVTILKNSLDSQKLHHAYLFTGSRGVGKTTIARIFAKALICEQGISSQPCNSCNFCIEVNQGNSLDVIEIDAASRTKVEDTRAILDNLAYAPTKARFKIYIIDEIHMLSNHSFNALLKSLEEPPKHIKFILATTDPQKLPITILSRCLQLKLKLLPVNNIIKQLEKILIIENKIFDKEGLLQLAITANGSMRDALSCLEQVLAFSDSMSEITYATVIQALNLPDELKTINLLKSVIISDAHMSLKIVKDLFLDNCDPMNILQNLQLIIKNIIILQLLADNSAENTVNNIILDDISNKQLLLELATLASEEDLQLYYEIAVQGFKNLPFTPDVKVGFEMVILRMLAFKTLKLPKDQQLTEKEIFLNNTEDTHDKFNINNNIINNKEFDYLSIIEKLEISGLTKDLAISAVFEPISTNVIKMIIDKQKKLMITNKNINNLQLAFSKLLTKEIKLTIEYIDFSTNPDMLHKTLKYQQEEKKTQFIANNEDLQQLIANFNGQIETIEGLSFKEE